nr:anthranilate synthase component I family protein [Bacillus ectoiniformans]
MHYQTAPYTKEQFFIKYKQLSKQESHHVFLESGRGGRYSIAGLKPSAMITSTDSGIDICTEKGTESLAGEPLRALDQWMEQYQIPKQEELPDFQGGAIGYISYDYARYIEVLPELAADDLGLPLVYFLVYDEWAVFDHETNLLWVMKLTENAEDADVPLEKWLEQDMENEEYKGVETADDTIHFSLKEEAFKQAVEITQEYISKGDVFQVNLSVRQSKELKVPGLAVYEQLRLLNPSPYMAFIHTPEFEVVSASPELLIKKSGMELSTRPIAGTRSRGKDEAEDLLLASELIENEKERAEHVMLVDLERNDLGRVSKYGTVEVNEFMVIEKYSHVMHIVSNVRGELAEGKTNADIIEAVFPGGTITGAPKVRTMEIIEELEPVQRGIYTGSIGWIGFNRDLELNIVIRTMLVKDGVGHVQAGAGIVIDSNPYHEYKESLKKASAVWAATKMAEEKAD